MVTGRRHFHWQRNIKILVLLLLYATGKRSIHPRKIPISIGLKAISIASRSSSLLNCTGGISSMVSILIIYNRRAFNSLRVQAKYGQCFLKMKTIVSTWIAFSTRIRHHLYLGFMTWARSATKKQRELSFWNHSRQQAWRSNM